MGYLNGVEPGLRTTMERRKLSLRERAGGDFIDVYWDDGLNYAPDDRGLPVGNLTVIALRRSGLMRRTAELWGVTIDKPGQHEVARAS